MLDIIIHNSLDLIQILDIIFHLSKASKLAIFRKRALEGICKDGTSRTSQVVSNTFHQMLYWNLEQTLQVIKSSQGKISVLPIAKITFNPCTCTA